MMAERNFEDFLANRSELFGIGGYAGPETLPSDPQPFELPDEHSLLDQYQDLFQDLLRPDEIEGYEGLHKPEPKPEPFDLPAEVNAVTPHVDIDTVKEGDPNEPAVGYRLSRNLVSPEFVPDFPNSSRNVPEDTLTALWEKGIPGHNRALPHPPYQVCPPGFGPTLGTGL